MSHHTFETISARCPRCGNAVAFTPSIRTVENNEGNNYLTVELVDVCNVTHRCPEMVLTK
jgi:hypothetical protein